MRILFFISHLGLGGTEKRLFEFIDEIESRDDIFSKLCVVTSDGDGDFFYRIKKIQNVNLLLVRKSYFYKVIDIFNIIRKFKPDIVHVFTFVAGLYISIISKMLNVKHIIVSTGASYINKNIIFSQVVIFFYRYLLRFISVYITNSYAGKLFLTATAGINEKKIIVIQNGLSFKKMMSKPQPNIPIKKKESMIIGSVCNLHDDKDPLNFIEASKILSKKYHNLQFILVGTGFMEKLCKDKIIEYGLENSFYLFTNRDDGPQISKLFDIAVLPSKAEAFPNVLLEYMYWSKPCVATNVGDCSKIIDNKITGYIVDSENSKALSEGIESVIQLNAEDYENMGKRARLKLESKYKIEHYCSNTLAVYNNLINRGN